MSRPRLSREWVFRGAIALLVVAYFVFRDELPEINLETIIEDLSKGLGAWTYLLVAALAFLETGAFVGLVAPGEFTVLLGGAVAGQGDISLPLILGITWLAAFSGDTVSFLLGARLGRAFLVKHGARVKITEERLHQVEGYFDKHGGKTILIGRFVGLVRALAPFIAGTSKMRYGAFAPYSILGTGLWAATFILIGYFASQSLDQVASIVSKGLIYFGFFVGIVVGLIVLYRYLREPENRAKVEAEMQSRAWLRPALALGKRLRPQAVFLWQRLTPGGLGLELTTLTAILAVALFVLVSYWSVVAGDPGPTGMDRTLLDLSNDTASGFLEGVAKGLSVLGSGYVVFSLAIVCAGILASMRRWAELGVLVAGMLVIAFLPDTVKSWTDRPRPPDPLTGSSGSSFPSGHAAHATFYTWFAVTVALRMTPGFVWRTVLIGAGIGVAAVIGLSRVYLRVHWLSDVSAGWALGYSAFAAAAIVALIFSHIRDNPGRNDGPPDRMGASAGAEL